MKEESKTADMKLVELKYEILVNIIKTFHNQNNDIWKRLYNKL